MQLQRLVYPDPRDSGPRAESDLRPWAAAQVCDIAAICKAAHAAGALVCVDNSIMAPVFQQPLALGADICMTSATKFVGGHSDLMAGILSVRGAQLAKRVAFHVVRTSPKP